MANTAVSHSITSPSESLTPDKRLPSVTMSLTRELNRISPPSDFIFSLMDFTTVLKISVPMWGFCL